MNLIEIENLSFAELKQRRDELIAAAKDADVEQLAARYVQARSDAKLRDEKLADQASTIASLRAGSEALTERTNASLAKLQEAEAELSRAASRIAELDAALKEATKRAASAEQLAKGRRAALATVMQTIAPLLAAE